MSEGSVSLSSWHHESCALNRDPRSLTKADRSLPYKRKCLFWRLSSLNYIKQNTDMRKRIKETVLFCFVCVCVRERERVRKWQGLGVAPIALIHWTVRGIQPQPQPICACISLFPIFAPHALSDTVLGKKTTTFFFFKWCFIFHAYLRFTE